ncbi:MAG TPA: GDSL-type esterase/lipase family protein [Chitinophagaceae bacterium]|nr:GDSL-type esterase/lipase family protein [Chitinophagaceae bacterium]
MKRILAIVTSLLFFTAYTAQSQVTNQRLFDTIGFIPEHYAPRVAKFQSEPIVTGRIIFLGNSITEMGRWEQLTGDTTVINRGIGGDITFGVLKRLDDVVVRQPSKVFLLIGINDIGKDIPDTVIADNIRKIVTFINQGSPNTKVYVQSVLPVNPGFKNFPQHYDKEEHVLHVNAILPKMIAPLNCTFVNIFPLFLDDKQRLDASLSIDGLHLNMKGYVIWIDYLKKNGYL